MSVLPDGTTVLTNKPVPAPVILPEEQLPTDDPARAIVQAGAEMSQAYHDHWSNHTRPNGEIMENGEVVRPWSVPRPIIVRVVVEEPWPDEADTFPAQPTPPRRLKPEVITEYVNPDGTPYVALEPTPPTEPAGTTTVPSPTLPS